MFYFLYFNKFLILYYLESNGDALFPHENSSAASLRVGSLIGARSEQYLNQLNRYQISKGLALTASEYERNWIRNFTNCVLKKIWKSKANYGLKATLGAIFLINLSKANEANKLNSLRQGKKGCDCQLYKSTIFSFGLFAGSLILI